MKKIVVINYKDKNMIRQLGKQGNEIYSINEKYKKGHVLNFINHPKYAITAYNKSKDYIGELYNKGYEVGKIKGVDYKNALTYAMFSTYFWHEERLSQLCKYVEKHLGKEVIFLTDNWTESAFLKFKFNKELLDYDNINFPNTCEQIYREHINKYFYSRLKKRDISYNSVDILYFSPVKFRDNDYNFLAENNEFQIIRLYTTEKDKNGYGLISYDNNLEYEKRLLKEFLMSSYFPKTDKFKLYFYVQFISSIWSNYLILQQYAEKLKPKVVLNVYESGFLPRMITETMNHFGINVIDIQHGELEFYMRGKAFIKELGFNAMAVWGSYYRKGIKKLNPNNDIDIKTTGFIGADDIYGLKNKYDNLSNNTVLVLSVYCFNHINYHARSKFLEGISKLANKYSEVKFLIKKHPRENDNLVEKYTKEIENMILYDFDQKKLYGIIKKVKVVIAIESTVLLEALALGVPAISYNTTKVPINLGIIEKNLVPQAKNFCELNNCFKEIYFDNRNHKYPVEEFIGPIDGKTKERIKKFISSYIYERS